MVLIWNMTFSTSGWNGVLNFETNEACFQAVNLTVYSSHHKQVGLPIFFPPPANKQTNQDNPPILKSCSYKNLDDPRSHVHLDVREAYKASYKKQVELPSGNLQFAMENHH